MNYVKSALKLELPRRPAVQDSATFSELMTLYNSLQLLHAQLSSALGLNQYTAQEALSVGLPTTARLGEMNTGTVQLTEAVAAGDLINLYNAPGLRGRKATKTAGLKRPAHAIALEAGSGVIRVCYGGYVKPGAYTPGAQLYLSSTGGFSASKTLVVGEVSQRVGVAVDADLAVLWPDQPFLVYAHNPQSTMTGSLLQDETGTALYGSGPIAGVTQYYEPVLVPL